MSSTPGYDALNAQYEEWAEIALASLGPMGIVLAKEDGLIPHVYASTAVELIWGGFAAAARDPAVTGDLDAINVKFEEWATIVLQGLVTDDVSMEDLLAKLPNQGVVYALPTVQWIWMGWVAGEGAG